jgi:hypothetical protein
VKAGRNINCGVGLCLVRLQDALLQALMQRTIFADWLPHAWNPFGIKLHVELGSYQRIRNPSGDGLVSLDLWEYYLRYISSAHAILLGTRLT